MPNRRLLAATVAALALTQIAATDDGPGQTTLDEIVQTVETGREIAEDVAGEATSDEPKYVCITTRRTPRWCVRIGYENVVDAGIVE